MKASDYIANYLESKGVRQVFELSGGMITHLLDSFGRLGKIRCISMRHEQAAAFAAEGLARMTGVPGVALATSGPGATNLLTGIGSCYFDSTPALFITGQVNRHEQKGASAVRQLGFQETDIVSMARPITKAALQVKTVEELPDLLERAFSTATADRPGPVLLDIPMDVQKANVEVSHPLNPSRAKGESVSFPPHLWRDLFENISKAKRPMVLVGGGIRTARVTELLRELVELLFVPVVHSLMAVDVLPFAHPLRVGLIGSYGNRWANIALGEADFLLVLGSRLDVRQTGSETELFSSGKTIIHVDCDSAEINNRIKGCEKILSELPTFLSVALKEARRYQFVRKTGWLEKIAQLRAQWPDDAELRVPGINPNRFLHLLSRHSRRAAAYVVDVGQHQMWAAQSLELEQNQRFLTSGGMGSMGFALPASIGVAISRPGDPIVTIAGDGGFQCNIQELQTVVHNRLPLKMVIINNHCHGMVRQFQESYFDKRYHSTLWGYSAPDFVKVAEAYGIPSRSVRDISGVDSSLEWLWSEIDSPALLDVTIDTETNVYPKIAFGHPITEMEPFVKPTKMEST